MTIRVDHRTVQRHGPHVTGLAAKGGECPEHADCAVEPDEPILLRHRAVVTDPVRRVDLSGAEWGCQRGAA